MLTTLIISAAISTAVPVPSIFPEGHPFSDPPKQESTLPSCATIPRRKERLSRYERRHPQLSRKEKAALRRLAKG